MVTERDYYEVLGIARGATEAEVKSAFRKLAQQWHPDVSQDATADARFKEINEAYQVLSDPAAPPDATTCSARPGSAAPVRAGSAAGFSGFGDIFDAFFGGTGGGTGARHGRPAVGSDLRYDLRLTFEEAIRGLEKEIEFPVLDRCDDLRRQRREARHEGHDLPPVPGPRRGPLGPPDDARPDGQRQRLPALQGRGPDHRGRRARPATATAGPSARKKLRVSIPAGIDEGHQVRLSGEGEVGPRGGPPGSLYVAVHVAPHAELKREGTELYYELDVSIAQAALGVHARVPTVDGDEEIEIKPGTQPGTEICASAAGACRTCGGPARRATSTSSSGSPCPSKLSKEQRQALEAYAEASGETVGHGHAGIIDRVRDKLG